MQLINRRTLQKRAVKNGLTNVSICREQLTFTRASERVLGLIEGKYIFFINDDKEWSFCQGDDEEGWPLKRNRSGNLVLYSKPLVKLLLSAVSVSSRPNKRAFAISKTNREMQSAPIYKILL